MTDEHDPGPLDTDDDDDTTRSWETDDEDAEDGILDDEPDDLVPREPGADRDSYWG